MVWFGASLAIFAFSVFDGLNVFMARMLGVSYPPTLVLVFGLLFCIVLLLSQTVMLSTQANRIRDLAQTVALLECRLRAVEEQRTTTLGAELPHRHAGRRASGSGPTPEPAVPA
ncbi:MAG: DUF2304 domain-containing protein [Caldilineaceae bacterium]